MPEGHLRPRADERATATYPTGLVFRVPAEATSASRLRRTNSTPVVLGWVTWTSDAMAQLLKRTDGVDLNEARAAAAGQNAEAGRVSGSGPVDLLASQQSRIVESARVAKVARRPQLRLVRFHLLEP